MIKLNPLEIFLGMARQIFLLLTKLSCHEDDHKLENRDIYWGLSGPRPGSRNTRIGIPLDWTAQLVKTRRSPFPQLLTKERSKGLLAFQMCIRNATAAAS